MIRGLASVLQDLPRLTDEVSMRRWCLCVGWMSPLGRVGTMTIAMAALLGVAATAVGGSPTITNTASLQRAVQLARSGDAEALLALADYLAARGDWTNAAGWYRAGAERGLPAAQRAYAACLADGLGVKRDAVEASRWSRLTAARAAYSATSPGGNQNGATALVNSTNSPAAPQTILTAPGGPLAALLEWVWPAPLVVARESGQGPAGQTGSTSPTVPNAISRASAPDSAESTLPPLLYRIPPEEVGAGIRGQRATDLPIVTPTLENEPAAIRPPDAFR